MLVVDLLAGALLLLGCGFFVAGTAGLLRFPDLPSRLHALTKADNLGLGLVVAGTAVHLGSVAVAVKLVVLWLLALLAAASGAQLLVRTAVSRRDER